MRGIITFIVCVLTVNFGYGQTTLNPGDIAITGFNTDTPDQFSFVLLTDITAGTSLNFTDNGLQTIDYNINDEGIVTWVADTDLSCGIEIIIEDTGSTTPNTYSATFGTATESGPGFALALNGDQILAYQGAASSPSYIYAITFGATTWMDSDDTQTTTLPPGLTDGQNAVYVGDTENGTYNCSVTSNQSLILAAVSTDTNWNLSNNYMALGGCTFTCVPCLTTVTWNGAWSDTPDLTTEVIIAADYNTSNGSFQACSLTIDAGFRLTVNNGTYVEVENDVTVNGELYVETQGNFVQNDDSGTFTNNGTSLVNKSTAPKANWFYYTYWSSPVQNETINGAFPNTDVDRRFSFNANNYIDSDGDDIDDNGDDWVLEAGTNILTPGVGYAATSSRFAPYPNVIETATFNGRFNTGNITTNISYNPINISGSWNFIGNPYPSAIDFIAFQAANSTIIDGTAYFWSQSLPPNATNPGNEVYNFSQNDYATYAIGTGGAAGASGIIPDQFIPSGQGFFIISLANGNATFTNAMRMADGTSNSQFFRTKKNKKDPNINENKLWINLTSDNGIFNQILIGYVDGATNKNDGLFYDAPRNLSVDASAILYSNIENEAKKFVIQGKDISSISKDEVISIGYKTSIDVPTIYSISIAQLEGGFLTNNAIYLKDNLLNKLHNLKVSDYNFTSNVGEFNDRFEIVFSQEALSLNEQLIGSNQLSIIEHTNGDVQFKLNSSNSMTNIKIIDLQGRMLYNYDVRSNDETLSLSNLSSAPYIAKITLDNNAVINKKAVKRY